jgi:hypothetical protein
MRQHQTLSCLIIAIIFSCLLSCNNAREEAVVTKNTSTSQDDFIDTYSDETIGANNTEATRQLAERVKSLLIFHADDTMQLNHAYTATLALAKDAILGELQEKVLDASDASDDKTIVDS